VLQTTTDPTDRDDDSAIAQPPKLPSNPSFASE